jgi:hypothetical protein
MFPGFLKSLLLLVSRQAYAELWKLSSPQTLPIPPYTPVWMWWLYGWLNLQKFT